MKQTNISLRELIDALIDIEQSGEGELVNGNFPVVGAFPDVTMLRVKGAQSFLHTSKIPLFGIEQGRRYVSLKLA